MSLSVASAMCVKRRAIFDFGVAHGFSSLTSTDVIRYLERTCHQDVSGSTKAVGRLLSDIRKRWKTANRKKDRFLVLNRAWLNGSLCLSRPTCRSPGGNRRRTPFSELSRNSKLRVTSELRRHSSRELVFAAASATYQEGRRSAGRLVEAVGSPVRGPPLAAALSSAEKSGPRPYTRVWNGLDQSAGFIIQSSPDGFGLDWIRNSPTQRILDCTGSRNVQCVSHI